MRKQVFVLVGIFFSLQSSAQHFCGFDSLILSLKQADPMFDQKLAIRNEMISDWLDWRSSAENQTNLDPLLNQTNFVIPVVFHVLHHPSDPPGVNSNLSYAQLQQAILFLNEQFAGIVPNNPTWGSDSGIQFCLAQDPWPFPGEDQIVWPNDLEKGVVRISYPTNGTGAMNLALAYDLAGINQNYFPSDRYLNVILCEVTCDDTFGQGNIPEAPALATGEDVGTSSYLQNGPEYADAVWVDYRELLSGVSAHEVGHYLNLFHVYQGGCQGGEFGVCNTEGDFVCDTPPCNLLPINENSPPCTPGLNGGIGNTCSENLPIPNPMPYHIAADLLDTDYFDLFGDFMGASQIPNDCGPLAGCLTYFTPGQIARMQASLALFRHQLSSAENLLATGVMPYCQPQVLNGDIFINGTCAGSVSTLYHPLSGSLAIDWDWTIFDENANILATFSDTPQTSFTFPTQGVYTVQLLTSDGNGNFACQQLLVQIQDCGCNQTAVSPNLIKNPGFESTNGSFQEPPPYMGLGINGMAFQTCPENNSPISCWETTTAINRIMRGYLDLVSLPTLALWSFGDLSGFGELNIGETWNEPIAITNDTYIMLYEYQDEQMTNSSGVHQYLDNPLSAGHYILEYEYGFRSGSFSVLPENFEKEISIVVDQSDRFANIDNYNNSMQYSGFSADALIISDDVSDVALTTWSERSHGFDIQPGTNLDALYFGTGGSPFESGQLDEYKMYLDDICLVPNNSWPLDVDLVDISSSCDGVNYACQFEITALYSAQSNQEEITLGFEITGPDNLFNVSGGDLNVNNEFVIAASSLLPGNSVLISITFTYSGAGEPTASYLGTLDIANSSLGGFICHPAWVEYQITDFSVEGMTDLTVTVTNETCDHLNNGSFQFTTSDCIMDMDEYVVSIYGPNGNFEQFLPLEEGVPFNYDNLDHGTYAISIFLTSNQDEAILVETIEIGIEEDLFIGSDLVQPNCIDPTGSVTFEFVGNSVGTELVTWDNGLPSGPAAFGLTPGMAYTATITYGANQQCVVGQSFVINAVPSLLLLPGTITNETCPGTSNGALTAIVVGVDNYDIQEPIEVSFDPNQNFQISTATNGENFYAIFVDNIAPGTYEITLEDDGGCSSSFNFTVNASIEELISLNATVVQPGCNNNPTGDISVVASGAPLGSTYIYNWTPDILNQDDLPDVIELAEGYYSVEVDFIDANNEPGNCPVTMQFQITQLTANALISNVLCNGESSGAIDITAVGGVPPLSYAWSNSAVTEDISNLAAGIYDLTITDSSVPACTTTESFIITQAPQSLVANAIVSDQVCVGQDDGTLFGMATGGIIPYTFQWQLSGGATALLPEVESVAVGQHILTVTDYNGCTDELIVMVDAASGIELTSSIIISDVLCEGDDTGSLLAAAAGGTMPYSYTWNDPLFTTGELLSNVLSPGGVYTVYVEDVIGCSSSTTFSIAPDGPLGQLSIDVQEECTNQENGEIQISFSQISGNPNYSWYDSQNLLLSNNEDLTGVLVGFYTFHFSDDSGCLVQEIEVGENGNIPVIEELQFYSGLCRTGFDGIYHMEIAGGSGLYSYEGSDDGVVFYNYDTPGIDYLENLPLVDFLGAGMCADAFSKTQTIRVTDDLGCQTTESVTITVSPVYPPGPNQVPPALNVSTTSDGIVCFGAGDGSAECIASNWTQSGAYEYEWYSGHIPLNSCTLEPLSSATLVSNGQSISNLGPGDYTCFILNNYIDNDPPFGVNDWSQCRSVKYITVEELDAAVITEVDVKEIGCHTSFLGLVDIDIQIEGTGASYVWSNGIETFIGEDLVTEIGGNWQLTVSYGDDCQAQSMSYELTSLANDIYDSDGNLGDGITTVFSTTQDPPVGAILHFSSDIEIENNAIWELDDVIIRMAPGKKIKVLTTGIWQDSELHADYTTFSDLCGTAWGGIEVSGGSQNQYRSESYLNNSIVEHATTGIKNYVGSAKGGYIGCTQCTLRDNLIDIDLSNYYPIIPFDAANVLSQGALFDNCSFTTTVGFTFPNTHPRIKMTNAGQVGIFGCTFINGNADLLDTQSATCIIANKSSFWLNGCGFSDDTECDGSIEGFTQGLSVTGELSDIDVNGTGNDDAVPFAGVDVRNMLFKVYRGVTTTASIDEITIANNQFHDLNLLTAYQNPPFGYTTNTDQFAAYAISTTGEGSAINIIENDIDFHLGNYRKGIVVDNALGYNNYIYRNKLYNLTTGLLLRRQNRTTSGIQAGLHFECNEFYNPVHVSPSNDVVIDGAQTPYSNNGVFSPQNGSNQGANFSAGNKFVGSEDPNVANIGDNVGKHITQVTTTMEYWWNDNDFGTSDLGAAYDFENMLAGPLQEKTLNLCDEPFVLMDIPEAIMMMENTASSYSAYKQLWLDLVDGGDTDALTEEVIFTTFAEALELHYELMSKSPNLSEEVMIEAINKEFDLPGILLTQILESNPTAAKSGRVQEKLDERMMLLDEYQRSQIMQGLEWISEKEELERDMSWQRILRHRAQQSLAKHYRNDVTLPNQFESILALYDDNLFIEERYQKARLLKRYGRYNEAVAMLEGADEAFKMDSHEITERDQLLEVWAMEFEMVNAAQDQLTESQLNYLEGVYYASSNRASQHALGLLLSYSDFEWYPDIAEESTEPRSYQLEKPLVENQLVSLYPNPANSFVIVELKEAFPNFITIKIWDSIGQIVMEQKIDAQQMQFILQLNLIEVGSYFITLNNAYGELIEVVPFIKE